MVSIATPSQAQIVYLIIVPTGLMDYLLLLLLLAMLVTSRGYPRFTRRVSDKVVI